MGQPKTSLHPRLHCQGAVGQSGTGSTGANGYHTAANAIANDDALTNIESTLNNELSNLHVANNANHQTALASIAELRTAITAAQQQIGLLAITPGNVPPAPTAGVPPPPAYNNYHGNNYRGGYQGNNYRGGYQGNVAVEGAITSLVVKGTPTLRRQEFRRHRLDIETTMGPATTHQTPPNGTTILTIVSPADTTSRTGTPATHATTERSIIRWDAHKQMWRRTKQSGTAYVNGTSSVPPCPQTLPWSRLDREGRQE